jgi:polyisoprenoid-binding protein YceI
MKKLTGILAAVVIALSAVAGNGDGEKSVFTIDTEASKVHWTGAKVTGEHTGHISIADGEVHVKDSKIVGALVKIDMNSITCTDLSGEWADKLVAHLKNDDFFSADKYPTSTFNISSIENGEVKGDLTIKGIKHALAFPAEITVNNDVVTASGTAKIDRTKYDIKYGSGKFFSDLGDRMINDEFEITFELKASQTTDLTSK